MNRRKLQRTPFEEAEAAPKKLGSEIKARIGQQLRAMYAEIEEHTSKLQSPC